MKRRTFRYQMDGLIALLLFGVFATCVLAVLLSGAGAYRRLVQRDDAAYNSRTCAQYLAARVRQADCEGGVAVEDFGGTPALALREGSGYVTRVYWREGYLMELYTSEDAELAPEDGEILLAADRLDLSMAEGLLTVEITAGGRSGTLRLSLRSGEGAAS